MPAFSRTETLTVILNVGSTLTLVVIGSFPWMLFSQRLFLAMFAPLTLLIAFSFSDRYQGKESFLQTVSLLTLLVSVQILLIHYSVIPEASPNYRTLFRALLLSIIPLIFLLGKQLKLRKVIAANVLVLFMGVVAMEGVVTLVSPKRSEANQWSDLASQFSEAPIPEVNPVVALDEQYRLKIDDKYRLTTDQPRLFSQRVFFYGGSTTSNREVSDGYTYPSLTQRLLNQEKGKVKVENRGTIGASAVDLLRFLEADESELVSSSNENEIQRLHKGDIVVFYIGVNEAKNAITYRDPVTRLSLQFSNFESVSNWVLKRTNVGYLLKNLLAVDKPTVDENYLAETEAVLKSASDFVTERGAVFIPIIQPHVFTKSSPTLYEQAIRSRMNQFPKAVDSVYPRLADLVLSFENGSDARDIFNNLQGSPYFDWCHVNTMGNEKIAEFMYKFVKPFIIGPSGF